MTRAVTSYLAVGHSHSLGTMLSCAKGRACLKISYVLGIPQFWQKAEVYLSEIIAVFSPPGL